MENKRSGSNQPRLLPDAHVPMRSEFRGWISPQYQSTPADHRLSPDQSESAHGSVCYERLHAPGLSHIRPIEVDTTAWLAKEAPDLLQKCPPGWQRVSNNYFGPGQSS